MPQYKTILLPCLPRTIEPIKGLIVNGELYETEKYTDPETGEELTSYNRGVHQEDIPWFFEKSKQNQYRVCMYAFAQPQDAELEAINKLLKNGLLDEFMLIDKAMTLGNLLDVFSISPYNAIILVDENNKPEKDWHKDPMATQTGENIITFLGAEIAYMDETGCRTIVSLWSLARNLNPFIYGRSHAFMEPGYFLYIGTGEQSAMDDYISENHQSLQDSFRMEGKTFVYLPLIQQYEQLINEQVIASLRYQDPALYAWSDDDIKSLIASFFEDLSPGEIYDFILQLFDLPHFRKPALLRLLGRADENGVARFTVIPIDPSDPSSISKRVHIFTSAFSPRTAHMEIRESCLKKTYKFDFEPEPEPAYDADDHFSSESREISNELQELIDRLQPTQYEALAKTALYIINKMQEERPELVAKLKPIINKRELPAKTKEKVLSRLVVSKHNRFFLPDYGNVEIKMHALPRSVYLLFLRHPEGIRFKELYEYRDELLSIYQKVTNRYDQHEIVKAVDDLVDMTKPSINQKCARIREAFRRVMEEDIAKHYYIDGMNGHPKKIALPADMIIFEQ